MSAIRFKVAPASAGKLALCFSALFAVAPVGHAQSIQAQQSAPVGASGVTVMTRAMASPAERPPVIDGRDDDAIWKSATAITGFRVFDPKEDGDPSFPTEAKIGYDAENLYVFTRMFDPHPDSIVSLLSRRDVKTQSEQIKIMIDSYHDRRTGYEFGVNPAGVKRDYYTYDDSREDITWDAVWDVATRIDSLGWTAEFRIPLSQIRYPHAAEHTFGLMIMRDIVRTSERSSWPRYRRSVRGIASQFGELAGLRGTRLTAPAGGRALRRHQEPEQARAERLRSHAEADRRRGHQVRADIEPHARRDHQPRFRAGRSRSRAAQSHRVRNVPCRAAAVLPRGDRDLQLCRRRVASLLLAANRPRPAARRTRR